ncbi:MAG: flavin reductase family protein [Bacillota bacterium]
MERVEISTGDLNLDTLKAWRNWLMLAAGHYGQGRFNAMTIAWGSLGNMWDKPVIQVAVRPSRYTYKFMEEYDSFTVSAFPPKYKKMLSLMGTKSGRHVDKIKTAELTPIPSVNVPAPGFNEAELIIECRKIYFDDFKPKNFLAEYIEPCYQGKDYHRFYIGEILGLYGTPKYIKNSLPE